MMRSENINELAKALCKFQMEMESIEKNNENVYLKTKYPTLHMIWKSIRLPLATNGLSISQTIDPGKGLPTIFPEITDPKTGNILNINNGTRTEVLITYLLHESGQWICSTTPLIRAKSDIQSYGGSITYCRRYSLQAILGLSADDDDGESAMPPPEQREAPKKSGHLKKPEPKEVKKDNKEVYDDKDFVIEDLVIEINKLGKSLSFSEVERFLDYLCDKFPRKSRDEFIHDATARTDKFILSYDKWKSEPSKEIQS